MDRRKEELELKRQKLAELRKAREDRKAALDKRPGTSGTSPTTTGVPDGSAKKEVDDLIVSLIGESPTVATSNDTDAQLVGSSAGRHFNRDDFVKSAMDRLKSSETFTFSLAPKTLICYDKEVQTSALLSDASNENAEPRVETVDISPAAMKEIEERLRIKILQEETERIRNAQKNEANSSIKDAKDPLVIEMPIEERDSIMMSSEFHTFIEKSSKIMEKIISSDANSDLIYKDYGAKDSALLDSTGEDGQKMTIARSFYDETYCKNTTISCTQWSSKFPEFCLAAYNPSVAYGGEPSRVLVWNMLMEARPEFVFESQSPVTTATFCDNQPYLIYGGCQSGQILLWDIRSNKMTPVLKSAVDARSGHAHPISSLSLIGTQNLYQLISCSKDGKMCSWQLDMLAKPVESLDLLRTATSSHSSRTDEVIVNDFEFFPQDPSTFMVGFEDGNLAQSFRYDKAGSKAGINPMETYVGHTGPVSTMNFNKSFRPNDHQWLLLTSGFDWTVKLWKISVLLIRTIVIFKNPSTNSNVRVD